MKFTLKKRKIVNEKVVKKKLISRIVQHRELYFLLLPVVAYFVIFHYWPMYGVQIAFKNFSPVQGITGSDWVGLLHFERFFDSK